MTDATGVMQLVVQLALEIISSDFSRISSLTPSTTVEAPSPLAGALSTTFFAPAVMWALAFTGSTKRPVDSITISTPRSRQGNSSGSLTASTFIFSPLTIIFSSS